MKPLEAPPAGVIDGSDTEEPDTEQPMSTKNLPEISGYSDTNFTTGEFILLQNLELLHQSRILVSTK